MRPKRHQCYTEPDVEVYEPQEVASAANWWNAGGCPNSVWADVWTAKAAASYAASLVGQVNGTTLTEGNGTVAWDASTGWQFAAASAQWLNTGIIPLAAYGIIIQFSSVVGTGSLTLMGANHNGGFYIRPTNTFTSTGVWYIWRYTSFITAPVMTAGNLALSRVAGWRNGVQDGLIGEALQPADCAIYIGARNDNGSASQFITANVQSVGVAKANFSAYVAALSAAMAAL